MHFYILIHIYYFLTREVWLYSSSLTTSLCIQCGGVTLIRWKKGRAFIWWLLVHNVYSLVRRWCCDWHIRKWCSSKAREKKDYDAQSLYAACAQLLMPLIWACMTKMAHLIAPLDLGWFLVTPPKRSLCTPPEICSYGSLQSLHAYFFQ